ncbi:hypothetical protein ATO7_07397 [Oceanococcus atlanticus]|uniref:Uncharacterized protein n=1 Tax=Oceanococcus atlanticus TaxID=1317117 RepID=A0A1Y1SCX7_9GAMM|nr:hypothetical protein [Oceanococcus atlanticus]ORE86846.1 hypothetical protein ATO7_07397 [Oceanococcus atlanticus]
MRSNQFLLFLLAITISNTALPASSTTTSHPHSAGEDQASIRAPEGLSIEILKPTTLSRWTAGQKYTIEVKTSGLDTAGDHWHLYLDGQLKAMVGGGRTRYQLTVPADIEPGHHEIKVTISNAAHEEYDLADLRKVEILRSSPQ